MEYKGDANIEFKNKEEINVINPFKKQKLSHSSTTNVTDFFSSSVLYGEDDDRKDLKNPTQLDSIDIKPVTLAHVRQKNKVYKKTLSVLFDTGAKYSCCKATISHMGNTKKKNEATMFSTPNGIFTSNRSCELEFHLSEFSENRKLKWNFHLLPESQKFPMT